MRGTCVHKDYYLKFQNTAIPYGPIIIYREWSVNTSYTGKFGFSKLLQLCSYYFFLSVCLENRLPHSFLFFLLQILYMMMSHEKDNIGYFLLTSVTILVVVISLVSQRSLPCT